MQKKNILSFSTYYLMLIIFKLISYFVDIEMNVSPSSGCYQIKALKCKYISKAYLNTNKNMFYQSFII